MVSKTLCLKEVNFVLIVTQHLKRKEMANVTYFQSILRVKPRQVKVVEKSGKSKSI